MIGVSRIAAHSAVARPSLSMGWEYLRLCWSGWVRLGGMWRPRSGGHLATRGGQAGGFR